MDGWEGRIGSILERDDAERPNPACRRLRTFPRSSRRKSPGNPPKAAAGVPGIPTTGSGPQGAGTSPGVTRGHRTSLDAPLLESIEVETIRPRLDSGCRSACDSGGRPGRHLVRPASERRQTGVLPASDASGPLSCRPRESRSGTRRPDRPEATATCHAEFGRGPKRSPHSATVTLRHAGIQIRRGDDTPTGAWQPFVGSWRSPRGTRPHTIR